MQNIDKYTLEELKGVLKDNPKLPPEAKSVIEKAIEMKGEVPPRSVVIPGSYTKAFPAGEFQVPCALIIGQRKESTDKKTSLNDALRTHNVAV